MSDPAAELNAEIRRIIVDHLTCIGRTRMAEAAKTAPLPEVVMQLVMEIVTQPRINRWTEYVERIAELERQLNDRRGDLPTQLARLNQRLTEANEQLRVLELQLRQAGAPRTLEGLVAQALTTAHQQGLVLTVTQEPLQPLAMGNYRTVARVRRMRERA